MSRLEDDIAWHRMQIGKLADAIASGEPGKAEAPGPAWGPKAGKGGALPTTLPAMRQQLARYEQTLAELEEQRGRGD